MAQNNSRPLTRIAATRKLRDPDAAARSGPSSQRRPGRRGADPGSASARIEAATLVSQVRNRLLADLMLDALSIRITAKGGKITLSGQVWRGASRKLAVQSARSVPGVSGVSSRIALAPVAVPVIPDAAAPLIEDRAAADVLLAARVKTALLEQLGIGSIGIAVEAADGVVVLSRSVPDRACRDHALRVARGITGVRELHDLLYIETEFGARRSADDLRRPREGGAATARSMP